MSKESRFSFRPKLIFKSSTGSKTQQPSPNASSTAPPLHRGMNRLDSPSPPQSTARSSASTTTTLIPEYNIDIIAIHGLNGHGFKTFTHANEKLWLRDFLPRDLPGARIWTYSYDSTVMFSRNTDGVRDYARRLLENVRLVRSGKEEQARPLIFICHSLGGIVVKQALIIAFNEAKLYPGMFASTNAILFFGCPHLGSSAADYVQILARIVNAAFIGSHISSITGVIRTDLFKSLQRNSSELLKIAEDFRVHTGQMQIASFVEKKKMKGLNAVVVDEAGSFLGAANEVRIPMEGYDHREICRFHSANDIGYQMVLGWLRSAAEVSEEIFRVERPEPSQKQKRERVISLPFLANSSFVGRTNVLNQIRSTFHGGRDRKIALYGLGGIGKSQILLNYAHLTIEREPDTSVFWAFAGNASRFAADYYEIARASGLKGFDAPEADILQMVKEFLEQKTSGPWLLLLDNIDDGDAFFHPPPAHVTDSVLKTQRSLASYLPVCQHGSILFSTRDKAVALELTEQGSIVFVDQMSPEDGRALLKESLKSKQTNDDSWTTLLQEVEYLPLAIVQAASYINQKSLTVSRYLSNYQTMPMSYLNHEFRTRTSQGGITQAVLKTWLITFEQIRAHDRRAADILCIMAFFHRQEIPYYLIQGQNESQATFDDSMGTLLAFSLVSCRNEFYSYSVHSLVQLAARLWINNQPAQTTNFAALALSSLSKWYPVDFQFTVKDRKWEPGQSKQGHETKERCSELLPHVDPVLQHNAPTESNIHEYERLLQNCHVYLRKRHQYQLSEQYITQLVDATRAVLGDTNTRTIHAIGELGYLHYCQGNHAASEAEVRKALTLCEAFPAPIDTLEALHRKLAWASQEQQKYATAESLHRGILERRKADLGMESPATLDSLDDLGYTLSRAGDCGAARSVLEAAVAGRGRVLGEEHPKTLRSVNRLAAVLREQGDWAAAETMGRRVVAGTELALGPRAGGSLRCKMQLALTLEKVHKVDEAEGLYREIVEIGEEVLEARDVGLLRLLVLVGGFCRRRGRLQEAARLYAKAKEGYEGRDGVGSKEALSCWDSWQEIVKDMNEEGPTVNDGEPSQEAGR